MSSVAPSPTQDAPDVAAILTAAADLLSRRGAWVQGSFARAEDRTPLLDGGDPRAVCWCSIGAIEAATPERSLREGAREAIEDTINSSLAAWNDNPTRTKAQVVAAFRRAAEFAKSSTGRLDTNNSTPIRLEKP